MDPEFHKDAWLPRPPNFWESSQLLFVCFSFFSFLLHFLGSKSGCSCIGNFSFRSLD